MIRTVEEALLKYANLAERCEQGREVDARERGDMIRAIADVDRKVETVASQLLQHIEREERVLPAMRASVSIPPGRSRLDTGNWEKMSKAEAELFIEARAREIAVDVVNEDRTQEDAGMWRAVRTGGGKLLLGVLLAIMTAIALTLGLVLVNQAAARSTSTTIVAPATSSR